MIDIHSHVIFGVDDGPKTLQESLALLSEAYRQGVRTVVATSHRRKGMFETPEEVISEHFKTLKAELAKVNPGMTLLYGGELYYTADILDKLETRRIPTLNGTRFALIEFSMGTAWADIHAALVNVLNLGITPVVAHIERYNALEFKKDRVQEIIDMGCYTQINSSHVLKPRLFGDKYKVFKKRAAYFLKEDLVHFVASDMHNLDSRPPYMREAREIITKQYGTKKAQELFDANQRLLLTNKFI